VARSVDSRGVCRFLVSRSEGKTTLGRPGSRKQNNIKMDLHDMRWGRMDCMPNVIRFYTHIWKIFLLYFEKSYFFRTDLHGRNFRPDTQLQILAILQSIYIYIYIHKHNCDPDIFYFYLHSLYFTSSSSAERNVTVKWQGRFGCLSFCFSWTAITLCGRIEILKAGGW